MQGENAAFAVLLLLDFCLFRSSVFVFVDDDDDDDDDDGVCLSSSSNPCNHPFVFFPPAPFRRPLARASRWLRQSEDPVIDQ